MSPLTVITMTYCHTHLHLHHFYKVSKVFILIIFLFTILAVASFQILFKINYQQACTVSIVVNSSMNNSLDNT